VYKFLIFYITIEKKNKNSKLTRNGFNFIDRYISRVNIEGK